VGTIILREGVRGSERAAAARAPVAPTVICKFCGSPLEASCDSELFSPADPRADASPRARRSGRSGRARPTARKGGAAARCREMQRDSRIGRWLIQPPRPGAEKIDPLAEMARCGGRRDRGLPRHQRNLPPNGARLDAPLRTPRAPLRLGLVQSWPAPRPALKGSSLERSFDAGVSTPSSL